MSKADIERMIDDMEFKLAETKENAGWIKSAVSETLNIVIPMMEDQLKILRALLAAVDE